MLNENVPNKGIFIFVSFLNFRWTSSGEQGIINMTYWTLVQTKITGIIVFTLQTSFLTQKSIITLYAWLAVKSDLFEISSIFTEKYVSESKSMTKIDFTWFFRIADTLAINDILKFSTYLK